MTYKSKNYDLSKMPERVRTLVANSDTTLAELSLKIGQGVNYLYEAFGHERNIPLAKILQIADIFDVSVDWLCGYGNWEDV